MVSTGDCALCSAFRADLAYLLAHQSLTALQSVVMPVPVVASVGLQLLSLIKSARVQMEKCLQHCKVAKHIEVVAPSAGPATLSKRGSPQCANSVVRGGMLNFGYSGGMGPRARNLAKRRWLDAGAIMDSLGIMVWFGIGCRRPAVIDFQFTLPGFPYIVDGHQSTHYDAVSLFYTPELKDAVLFHPEWSTGSIDPLRSCWVECGTTEIWGALYVPPRDKDLRQRIVSQYWSEWHAQQQRRRPEQILRGCGDLNMDDDVMVLFMEAFGKYNVHWASSNAKPTHIGGGILDFVWEEQHPTHDSCDPTMHDGGCKEQGCKSCLCGRIHEATGSSDLDHHPWSFYVRHMQYKKNHTLHYRQRFSNNPEDWEVATESFVAKAMASVAQDIDASRRARSLWFTALTSRERRAVLSACSWLWSSLMTLAGWAQCIVHSAPLSDGPRVPKPLRSAFAELRSVCGKASQAGITATSHHEWTSAKRKYKCARQQCAGDTARRVAATYKELLAKDVRRADRYLSAVTKMRDEGLPGMMCSLDGTILTGHEVMEGANAHLISRGSQAESCDKRARDKYDRRLAEIRAEVSLEIEAAGLEGPAHLDDAMLDEALRGIRVGAGCKGVPYAAIVISHPASRHWHREVQGLALDLGLSISLDTIQDVYHARKSKKPRGEYSSYRTLFLVYAESRLQDEIWCIMAADRQWEAAGTAQFARKNNMVALAADVTGASLRDAAGLPHGMVFLDRKDAFTSSSRAVPLIKLFEKACIGGRLHSIADDRISNAGARVIRRTSHSREVQLMAGFAEGMKISPGLFCLGHSALEEDWASNGIGVGLDPPAIAVAAYQLTKDGTDDQPFDKATAEEILMLIMSRELDWVEGMKLAANDTMRLLLLDLASTVRQGLRIMLDDTRCGVSSPGHAEISLSQFDDVAYRDQYLYNAAKSAITSTGFNHPQPVSMRSGVVRYARSQVALGFKSPDSGVGGEHLSQFAAAASAKFHATWCAVVTVGLSMEVFLMELDRRVVASACYACELTVHHPQADKVLNRGQAQWLRNTLGLAIGVPRIVMMHEIGTTMRLSSLMRCRALALRMSIRADPRYKEEAKVIALGESVPSSWAYEVARMERSLTLGQWQPCSAGASRTQLKALAREYKQAVVVPAVRDLIETKWLVSVKNVSYWRTYNQDAWTVKALSQYVEDPRALQAWAQLKLQQFFTSSVGTPFAAPSCVLCGHPAPESAMHLLEECPRALQAMQPFLVRLAALGPVPPCGPLRTSYLLGFAPTMRTAMVCVQAVYAIQKLRLKPASAHALVASEESGDSEI